MVLVGHLGQVRAVGSAEWERSGRRGWRTDGVGTFRAAGLAVREGETFRAGLAGW
jgi:hypothetical protein